MTYFPVGRASQGHENPRSSIMNRQSQEMRDTLPFVSEAVAEMTSPTLEESEITTKIKIEALRDLSIEVGENNNSYSDLGSVPQYGSGDKDGLAEVEGISQMDNEDNDVKFLSSSQPKRSTKAGRRSQCAECNVTVSSTYMRRHIKQYHCPRGKFYEAAPVPKRMVEQIKCEYCGKTVARSYHARHIQDVHQKKCKWCRKTFSFIQSRNDHERICRLVHTS